jgi:hypothetical protein
MSKFAFLLFLVSIPRAFKRVSYSYHSAGILLYAGMKGALSMERRLELESHILERAFGKVIAGEGRNTDLGKQNIPGVGYRIEASSRRLQRQW